jgi:hypothetical protein
MQTAALNRVINNKSDDESVDKINSMGYPDNEEYLNELLIWTADPNWPNAGTIYIYFISLGKRVVTRVLNLADKHTTDLWWKYTLLVQIISFYDDETLSICIDWLKSWAKSPGAEGCEIEALSVLVERKLIGHEEI